METAEITSLPELTAPVGSEADFAKVNRLVELLEDHDDVQHVWYDFDIEAKEIEASLE